MSEINVYEKMSGEFGDFLVSRINSNVLSFDYVNRNDFFKCLLDNDFFIPVQKCGSDFQHVYKTISICLCPSVSCNLQCKYCFINERKDSNLSFEDCKNFIDLVISSYPDADRYIVDLSGTGEPLLNKELLFTISDYCVKKSNEIIKEILPMLVCNGTLLTKNTAKELSDHLILYGISIDGIRKDHDRNRVYSNGKGTYNSILSNIKKIKNRKYIGAAVTITGEDIDLVKTVKELSKYFPTISIKPVRSNGEIGINKNNFALLCIEYRKFARFIVKQTTNGNLKYIYAILNGDDYLGKYIFRLLLNYKVETRCDAGFARFFLAPDKNIYTCPAATRKNNLIVGSLLQGISKEKINQFFTLQHFRNQCIDCSIRYLCGGECLVVSSSINPSFSINDAYMCAYKKELVYIAAYIVNEIRKNSDTYAKISDLCIEKTRRFQKDEKLTILGKKYKGEYSFTQLKTLRDCEDPMYHQLLEVLSREGIEIEEQI